MPILLKVDKGKNYARQILNLWADLIVQDLRSAPKRRVVMPSFLLSIVFQQAIGVGSIVEIIVLIIILGFYKSYHWSANKKLFQRKTN